MMLRTKLFEALFWDATLVGATLTGLHSLKTDQHESGFYLAA